jgi:hypothetical protein
LQPIIAGLMAKQAAERFNTGAATVEAIQQLVAKAPEGVSLHHSAGRKAGPAARLSGSAATQQRTRVSLSKQAQRPSWQKPVAALGVLMLAVAVALVFWPKPEATQVVSDSPATVEFEPATATATDGTPLTASFPAAVAPMAADEIENALTRADVYLAKGTSDGPDANRFLVFPEDDSALYLYQRVLSAEPTNVRAKKGIAALVSYYRRNAHKLCMNESWVFCGNIARTGLQIDPADETLVKLNVAAEQGQRGETPSIPPLPAE